MDKLLERHKSLGMKSGILNLQEIKSNFDTIKLKFNIGLPVAEYL